MKECHKLTCNNTAKFKVESNANNGPTHYKCAKCVAKMINVDSSRLTKL